jgi:hypothetical protein
VAGGGAGQRSASGAAGPAGGPAADLADLSGGEGPDLSVDGMFARLRAGRAVDLERAAAVLVDLGPPTPPGAPVATPAVHPLEASSDRPDSPAPARRAGRTGGSGTAGDAHAALDWRDGELEPHERALTRALKRALADEQNRVLDALRRAKTVPDLDVLVAPPADHAAGYARLAEPFTAAVAGAARLPPTGWAGAPPEGAGGRSPDRRRHTRGSTGGLRGPVANRGSADASGPAGTRRRRVDGHEPASSRRHRVDHSGPAGNRRHRADGHEPASSRRHRVDDRGPADTRVPSDPDLAVDATSAADALGRDLVARLRIRVARALDEAAGSDAPVGEAVSVAYRDARSRRAELVARQAVAAAWGAGAFAVAPDDGLLRWLVDPGDPCSSGCADNASAGPTRKGRAFPTGHRHPPAHPGCRCLLVATSR